MMEIAAITNGEGVFQKDIAKNQNISIKYLDHIISALKVAGLVTNVRGKKSGYQLTRDANEITMLDIHNAFEPGICIVDCLAAGVECSIEQTCAVRDFWDGLNETVIDYLQSFTLQELVNKQQEYKS